MNPKIWPAVLALVAVGLFAAACRPVPCSFAANKDLTAYRLPDASSDVFGTLPAGTDQYRISARTADGWIGFDPGVAQAGNVGLARNRWILPDTVIAPSCLAAVPLVTLADVDADVDASH